MRGTYILVIRVKKKFKKKIGSLGVLEFKSGWYLYVGSAMGKSMSIENRISRHLKKKKKLKWHIDYLLDSKNAKIEEIIIFQSDRRLEEVVSNKLASIAKNTVKGFGSSDCKTLGNLHYFRSRKMNFFHFLKSILPKNGAINTERIDTPISIE